MKKVVFLSLILISIFIFISKIDALQIFEQALTDKNTSMEVRSIEQIKSKIQATDNIDTAEKSIAAMVISLIGLIMSIIYFKKQNRIRS